VINIAMRAMDGEQGIIEPRWRIDSRSRIIRKCCRHTYNLLAPDILTQDMHTSDNLYASVKNKSALNSNMVAVFVDVRYTMNANYGIV